LIEILITYFVVILILVIHSDIINILFISFATCLVIYYVITYFDIYII